MYKRQGPGVFRKDGYVVGVSLATKEKAVYLDIAHPDTTPERKERNLRIIKDILAKPTRKVGANIVYDLDWLVNNMGIEVKGPFEDIQYAEPVSYTHLDVYKRQCLHQQR